ncbi:nucleoside deaminase [Brevibacterium sp. K72]|uniref:nucleoside deaminase n=1 Tax=Brevibacterium sp. K72 TaxID=3390729 RepID=UPI003D2FD189
MSTVGSTVLAEAMERAVDSSIEHVRAGGLPFVGLLTDDTGIISGFGVNRVQETGDPSAHAEIVAMREVLSAGERKDLAGTALLATGEPCGLCYRFAIDHGVETICVAVDRDAAARWGFDYRSSYSALGITDDIRASLLHHLPTEHANKPFSLYVQTQTNHGR